MWTPLQIGRCTGQGVEATYEGTPVFLAIPGSERDHGNDIMDSLVTTCTHSNDTFARPHVKLESIGKSFLALREVTDVFLQLVAQNRIVSKWTKATRSVS